MTRKFVIPESPHWPHYGHHIFVGAVKAIAADLGFQVESPVDVETEPGSYGKNDVIFFVENYGSRQWWRRVEATGQRGEAFRIFFNLDPLKHRSLNQAKDFQVDAVLDYNHPTTQRWKSMGWFKKVAYCGMGYHESYENYVHRGTDGLSPDGIHLLSGPNARRLEFLKMAKKRGVKVVTENFLGDPQRTMAHSASPGVHLNVHRTGKVRTFGWIRILMFHLMAKSFILSEDLDWVPEGLEPGVHWDVAKFREIPERAVHWFQRPEERAAIGLAGYEFMKKNHRLEDDLPKALERIGVI